MAHEDNAAIEMRALFAAMTDRVLMLDRDGRYLRIPRTNAPALFDDPAALLGRTLHQVRSKERADLLLGAIRQCLETQATVTVEYPLEPPNQDRWMAAAISPASEDTVLVVVRDITERVNAQTVLEHRVEERTRELTAILETSHDIGSTIELKPLLQLIIEHVKAIADYDLCSIYLADGDELVLAASRALKIGEAPVPRLPMQGLGPLASRLEHGELILVGGAVRDTDIAESRREVSAALLSNPSGDTKSWMIAPLVSKEHTIGILVLSTGETAYTEHHGRLVRAIAIQAAISIENARLHEQTLQLATLDERQRLARELHDSVSQALYGIALGAQTARTMLPPDAPLRQPVDYILSLAQSGMAEMRALIFELRPESLEVEGLAGAIEKQVHALEARYGLEIETDLPPEPSLALSKKEVLYRITQEALNNIVKHAHATRAKVRLTVDEQHLLLEVSDNGAGFDTFQSFPGHIGLMSMNERAAAIGGHLEVTSVVGTGTTVRLTLDTAASPG